MLEVMTNQGDGKAGDWTISTCQLSCGLHLFQGWSNGVGIDGPGNDKLFEERMFVLLYYSAYPTLVPHHKHWGTRFLEGPAEASVSISRARKQFLHKDQSYLISSTTPWMQRFEHFIRTHNLGEFTLTHKTINKNYRCHEIQVGLWTWNGNVPTGEKFTALLEADKKAA